MNVYSSMTKRFAALFEKLFVKKVNWTIVADYQQTKVGQLLNDFDQAYHYKGVFVEGRVYKINIENKNYYLKKFVIRKRLWVRVFSFSKVMTEYNNLMLFKELGIPTANIVAYGEETLAGVVQRGILITEELVNCHDLVDIADNFPQLLQQPAWFKHVSQQLSDMARKMHQHRFAHSDFKWRNILVDTQAALPNIYLIDCPAGMRWFWPFLEYRIIKDLACLDKRAKYECSKKQRLAFYKDYAQCKKLTEKDKKRIRKILGFFHNRE